MPDISITENHWTCVLKLVCKLAISKAAGPDGIRPRILKELAPILTLLFKASLYQQCLPDIWEQANVTPIYKKGDKTSPANYRPVSWICICCKVPAFPFILCRGFLTPKFSLYPPK